MSEKCSHLAMDQKEDLEIITKSSQQVDSTNFFYCQLKFCNILPKKGDSNIALILLACVETGPGCHFPHSYNKNLTKETFLEKKEKQKPPVLNTLRKNILVEYMCL